MNSALFDIIFWLSCFCLFWTYFGYHLFLWLYSAFFTQPVLKRDITPSVSVVITAYNEEVRIARKLENCLALDYPDDKLEIILVSDGSSDGTVAAAEPFVDRGLRLIDMPQRLGKHSAQEIGVDKSSGEIVIFTDSSTILDKCAVRNIVRNFADPRIGCVSGIDEIETSDKKAHGEGLYVMYEMKLRLLESQVSSLLGVSGSFFAVRRAICEPWYNDLSSDFWIPLQTHMNGLRTVIDPEAVGTYGLTGDPDKEFGRKVRTVVHGLDVLFSFAATLNPFKHGLYAFQMINHKLFRWLVPLFLILCMASNVALIGKGELYQALLAIQIALYLAAASAYLIKSLARNALFRIPYFFVMVNLSILVAWIKYLGGERFVTWERTSR